MTNIVKAYHDYLLSDKPHLDDLMSRRGLTMDTIKRFRIGYTVDKKRYVIPVYNSLGSCLNMRLYAMGAQEAKMIWYEKGGENTIFNVEALRKERDIVICEGEMDCMLLCQNGYNAITQLAGALSWKDEWNTWFIGKKVTIIYDCDDAGHNGAQKVYQAIKDYAVSVKIIDLGLDKSEDVTDFIVKYQRTDLQALIDKTPIQDDYQEISLADGLNPQYYMKKIKFYGIIIGKDTDPYLIPKDIVASCNGGDKKRCELCPLKDCNILTKEYNVNDDRQHIVRMIGNTDVSINSIIKSDLHLPQSKECTRVKIDIKERMIVEDISIIPEIDFERIDEQRYVSRKAYVFGDTLETNQSFLFKGTTYTNPDDQAGIHLVFDKQGSNDAISKFVIDEQVKKNLKIFQPEKQTDAHFIQQKLKEIHTDFEFNICRVYGRTNLITATDFVYHSCIAFDFNGEHINRGWLECAIIGDTRTGKTKAVKALVKHFRSGEFMTSAESVTRSGILGGSQQRNGRWTLTWGKLPLNDRGILIVDEADELSKTGVMSLLSGARSSGVAEVAMIQSQKTYARTRIIWIANPLHHRMNEYNYGIDAVKEIFGSQQDIARVDFAIICNVNEVNETIINQQHMEIVPHKYTSDLCKQRVMWAWNRKSDNIKWMNDAEKYILQVSHKLGNIYTPEIPLMLDTELRIKIARMAIACACCVYSTDDTGENVLVYPAHVQVVEKYLDNLYNNSISGYFELSEQRRRARQMGNTEYLDKLFVDQNAVELFLEINLFSVNDIMHMLDLEMDSAKSTITSMVKGRAIRRDRWYFKKTPSFIEYLKKRKYIIKQGDLL